MGRGRGDDHRGGAGSRRPALGRHPAGNQRRAGKVRNEDSFLMPAIILLDTGPLSHCVVAPARRGQPPTLSQQCRAWITDCERAGALLLVPAIAYYEALREI